MSVKIYPSQQTISRNGKLYRTSVNIFFTREEARLIRRAVEPWEGYLDDNFRKGSRISGGVSVEFLGWELCELTSAVEMEAKVADERAYAELLQHILEEKVLPVKERWLKANVARGRLV